MEATSRRTRSRGTRSEEGVGHESGARDYGLGLGGGGGLR